MYEPYSSSTLLRDFCDFFTAAGLTICAPMLSRQIPLRSLHIFYLNIRVLRLDSFHRRYRPSPPHLRQCVSFPVDPEQLFVRIKIPSWLIQCTTLVTDIFCLLVELLLSTIAFDNKPPLTSWKQRMQLLG